MGNVFLHDQSNRIVGVAGANGRIVVSCPSGAKVRAILGETVHTATADLTGEVVFSGLTQGSWTVEINDGNQTVTKNVEVLTDYEIDMEFITAEISIDYPYGSRCTCTNGVVEYKAPDTSSHWDLTVSDVGTWTITCTNGIRTETRAVEIIEHGQVENVEISYFESTIRVTFPVGGTCTCYKDGVYYTTPDYSGTSGITTITHDFVVGEPGEWTVSCTKDGRTEYRYIKIVSDGQTVNSSINFFEAALNITYSAGHYCTCVYGDMRYTSPDTSGSWAFSVPEPGTWTVVCTNNGLVKSESVDITTDGETKSVNIDYFLANIGVLYPEGYTCTIELNGETYVAPDTSGSWIFEAPRTGTYVVTCVTDYGTKTESVAISEDWQADLVNLTDFSACINITYPAGATCTCSDGMTTYTATNTSGSWRLFVPRTGTWTIIARDSEQEIRESVVINGDGQNEDVTLKFFSVTLNITYTSGATCTCTDGTTVYTNTDGSGYWVLKVPRPNEWEIKVTLNDQTVKGSVFVNVDDDGQTINKTVKFFEAVININYPAGAECTCTDNIDTYYAPNNSGSWSLVVPRAGTWKIEATLDEQNCEGSVEITADEQVTNITVKFFEATIRVQPRQYLVTLTCTDGISVYEYSDTGSKYVDIAVPNTGNWTISGGAVNLYHWPNRIVTSEKTVSITSDGQTENVVLDYPYAKINVRGTSDIPVHTAVLWLVESDGEKTEIYTSSGDHPYYQSFYVYEPGNYEIYAYRETPYDGIELNTAKFFIANVTVTQTDILNSETFYQEMCYKALPVFTYSASGAYDVISDDGISFGTDDVSCLKKNGNWNLLIYKSGVLKFTELNSAGEGIDVFVCGGGGNGGKSVMDDSWTYGYGGGGGGGGYRSTSFGESVATRTNYSIVVGGAGGSSSAFGVSADGGSPGNNATKTSRGAGGSGGSAGGAGANRDDDASNGANGEYPFLGLENTSYRYGAGGGGGCGSRDLTSYEYTDDAVVEIGYYNGYSGSGGKDGGGMGNDSNQYGSEINGGTNSGGGGGGGGFYLEWTRPPGTGGSGIVIIRNKR